MDIEKLRLKPLDEVRRLYREYLISQNFAQNTINVSSDAFYLWNKCGKELFWDTVLDFDFDKNAKERVLQCLRENSAGDADKLVHGYMSHLRRFRRFLATDYEALEVEVSNPSYKSYGKKKNLFVPTPSISQVEFYLEQWHKLENYRLQEEALNKLFFELAPRNTDVTDILLKVSTLNDFYSTNIYSTYPVAKHIQSLKIDDRLKSGDVSLVDDIQLVVIGDKEKHFYSFATKYCSHHNPKDYPIYDSYVDEVLRFFRSQDHFSAFYNDDLKNYALFKKILNDFREFYGLNQFDLKQIDQYLWQLGKEYFKKDFGKKQNAKEQKDSI